jgi:hypothetical protein
MLVSGQADEGERGVWLVGGERSGYYSVADPTAAWALEDSRTDRRGCSKVEAAGEVAAGQEGRKEVAVERAQRSYRRDRGEREGEAIVDAALGTPPERREEDSGRKRKGPQDAMELRGTAGTVGTAGKQEQQQGQERWAGT